MGKQDRKALQRSETHQKIKQLKAKTANQADYIDSLYNANQIIAYGPPGTGKTYMAAAHAGDLFASRQIQNSILTRPAVAVDEEDLGFLPGELDEKFQQWAIPLTEVIKQRIGMDSKVVINGDVEKQYAGSNALRDIIHIADTLELPVDVIELGPEDIVRSPQTAMWVDAISKYEKGEV